MTNTIRFNSINDLQKYWKSLGYETYFKDSKTFLAKKKIPVDNNDTSVSGDVRIAIKKYLTNVNTEIRFPQIKLGKKVLEKVVSTDYEITPKGLLPRYTNSSEKTSLSYNSNIILLSSLGKS